MESDRGRDRSRSPRRQKCTECNKSFSSSATLRRHIDEQHLKKKEKYACPYCQNSFSRKHDLDRHWQNAHKDPPASVARGEEVPRTPGRDLDVLSIHPNSPLQPLSLASPPPPRPLVPHLSLPSLPPLKLPLQHLTLTSSRPSKHPQQMARDGSPPFVRRVIVTPGEMSGDGDQRPTQDVAVQTTPTRAVKERTIKELLDGNTVVARIITERFVNE